MAFVYGDSTPFPYELDFIALVRQVVQCGVRLLQAQANVDDALARRSAAEQTRTAERARLDRLSEAVRLSMQPYMSGPERQMRVASRVVESAKFVVDGELSTIDATASDEGARATKEIEGARREVFVALESFLRTNDVPGTEVALRLYADEESYAGQVTVSTPFGVEAIFHSEVPGSHEWGRPRRVGELSAGTEVHVPQETGLFSKRIEPKAVKLDKLFVTEIAATSSGSRMTLKKTMRTGPGYGLEVAQSPAPRATLRELDESGHDAGNAPLELDDDDSAHVFRLWNAILATTQDLMHRRKELRSASFEGKSVLEHDAPRVVAAKLVESLAPTVREIERRSGTPRELVLRRDLAEGRRQETYVTKAELHDLVCTLPTNLRSVFAPFELDTQRLSMPPKREPEEVSAELVLEDER
jgi:hypothetical protein